jgi:hypothetical protein
MFRHLTTGSVVLTLGLATSGASAALTASYQGYGTFQTHGVGYSSNQAWNSTSAVTMFNLKLAEHRWTVDGQTVYTWCAQLYQGITAGSSYTYDAVALELAPQSPPAPGAMGSAKATILRDAMHRFLDADGRANTALGSQAASTAAFCALAWEIIHENLATSDVDVARSRLSLQTGAFRANLSGEAAVVFSEMVSALGSDGYRSVNAEGWASPTAQDQFRLIPAPGALALLGLAGLAGRRRR